MSRILILLSFLSVACSSSIAEDEMQIISIRHESNAAIARHDALAIGQSYTDDFTLLSSSNIQVTGKDKMVDIFRKEFATKKEVLYVRTPYEIEVNTDWNMASEFGYWKGYWQSDNEKIEILGNYYAKWHKIGERWLIRSETYTPLRCTGDSYCSQTPF